MILLLLLFPCKKSRKTEWKKKKKETKIFVIKIRYLSHKNLYPNISLVLADWYQISDNASDGMILDAYK